MGFLAGSLVLIVTYTLLQPGAANQVSSASNVGVQLLRRALSPQVAGVPKTKAGDAGGSVAGAEQSALDATRQYVLQHPAAGSPAPMLTPVPQGRIR